MTNKKICVYAICKNEMKFLDKWLENMSEADYVVVLDTGSTDGSYEFLQNDPRCYKVEQKIIDPWRFDVARNESMKLIPEDAEIYVCTDPDELFEPGWCTFLREKWIDGAERGIYKYAWNHNEVGDPMNEFMYDKIHIKGYHWRYPIHEVLWPDNKDSLEGEKRINLADGIQLHHWQDLSVGRKNYLPLLKISVDENLDDPHVRHLYAREFILQNQLDIAYRTFFEVLNLPRLWTEPQFIFVKLDTYFMLASLAAVRGDAAESIYWCQEFIKIDNTYREPYLKLAEIYNSLNNPKQALIVLNEMNKVCFQHYSWVEKQNNWVSKDKELFGITMMLLGDYEKALEYINIALQHEPNNIDMLKNKVTCLEQLQKRSQGNDKEVKNEERNPEPAVKEN